MRAPHLTAPPASAAGLNSAHNFKPVSDAEALTADGTVRSSDTYKIAGVLTGVGKITYADGRIFTGPFRMGRPIGSHGALSLPTFIEDDVLAFDSYVGELSAAGFPDGHGTLECADADIFVGSFARGLPNGRTKALYTSGAKYEGQVANGLANGRGSLTCANGEIYIGNFEHGLFCGRGRLHGTDGSVHDGLFVQGQKHGRGRVYSLGGATFDSTWRHGERQGLGITQCANGERQEAWYVDDKLARVPRIFFPVRELPGRAPGRLPGAIVKRTTGASLRAFLDAADVPVRVCLRPLPSWLIAKRLQADPVGPPPLLAQLLVHDGGYVRLSLSSPPPPPPARARAFLRVSSEPPKLGMEAIPFDAPARVLVVKLELFAMGERAIEEEVAAVAAGAPPSFGCGLSLVVPPLMEWSVPHDASPAGAGREVMLMERAATVEQLKWRRRQQQLELESRATREGTVKD